MRAVWSVPAAPALRQKNSNSPSCHRGQRRVDMYRHRSMKTHRRLERPRTVDRNDIIDKTAGTLLKPADALSRGAPRFIAVLHHTVHAVFLDTAVNAIVKSRIPSGVPTYSRAPLAKPPRASRKITIFSCPRNCFPLTRLLSLHAENLDQRAVFFE